MWWLTMKLVSSFICLGIVLAGESGISMQEAKESWLSMKNLTTLLQVSFTVSQCCNVFISGESARTENILYEFSKTYKHGYVLNSRTYNCNGYFMISKVVDNLVAEIKSTPTISERTELLIIVDDNIKDVSEILNISIYENANVNIVALNGLWSLSEETINPRVFKKLSRYDEMIHKREIVNFGGRELRAGTLGQPPYCYLPKILNRTDNGVEAQFFDSKNKSALDGIEVKIFMLIAERLNFTWNLRKPNSSERYGYTNGTHWHGGAIGMLLRKEVDIAFGNIWLTSESYRFVNMTPWVQSRVHFLVPRPKRLNSFWALTRPLSNEVWLAVIAMLILQSFYVYTSAWISPRITKRFRSFTVTWTELIGRLIGTGSSADLQGLKIQFHIWHFIGILVVTAYGSSLAADLTNSRYEKRIDTPRDFMKANLTWGQQGSLPNFNIMFDENDRYGKRFRHRYVAETSDYDRHEKILRGNYAVQGVMIESRFYPEDPVRPEDLKNFRVMKESLSQYYSTFVVQPWLLKSTDKLMLRLKEVGLVHYHVRDVIRRRTGYALREVTTEHDGYLKGARVLRLTPLTAGFSMLIVGLLISTVVFYIELYSASQNSSIREVFLEIKKNRENWRDIKLAIKYRRSIIKVVPPQKS